METWWTYEMPSAQAAYDAVFDLILNYNHREVTGLGAVSREGKDDRDHLYVFAWSEDPSGPVEEIDELLDDHGRGRPSPCLSSLRRTASNCTHTATD